jgi:hypothetical protein
VQIQVGTSNSQYVSSSFDADRHTQQVVIDMSSEGADRNWDFDLVSGDQVEKIRVAFKYTGESADSHSFFSFSLDWP